MVCPCTKSQCQRTVDEEVIAVNKSLQVLLSCGICCCLQTCKFGYNNEVIWCAHVPSLNVMGQYMRKLQP